MALNFTPLVDGLEKLVEKNIAKKNLIVCNGTTMPSGYKQIAEKILNMEVREDDTWVCTFPKNGTSWVQELVWCIANDLDFEGAKISQVLRFPYLEIEHSWQGKNIDIDMSELELDPTLFMHSCEYVQEMKSPRFIKTHLPFRLLPLQLQRAEVKPKIIHVIRNPMDTCVSFFHHSQLLYGFTGSVEDFATLFVNDAVIYSPYWSHYLSYIGLQKNKEHNVLYLKYEEMIKDLPYVIRKTADFYGKSLTAEETEKLCNHLSFNNMRNNKATNLNDVVRTIQKINHLILGGRFMREGTVGQWKSRLSPEWVRRFEKWTEENTRGNELCKPLEYYGFDIKN